MEEKKKTEKKEHDSGEHWEFAMKWQFGFLLISNIIINHWCEDQNLFLNRLNGHFTLLVDATSQITSITKPIKRHSWSRPEEGSDCVNLGQQSSSV